jgi:quinol monooxygenase YgiN
MINVIASIHIKKGKLSDYLQILKASVPAVKKEKGCIEYLPAGDIDTGLPLQVLDDHVVTILDRWESLEALNAHLLSPHMLDYREKVKDIVDRVSVKVLRVLD